MKAIPEGPYVVVIGAAGGSGRATAIDVAASSAGALSLAGLSAAGLKRISGRLPGEIRVKTPVEGPSDAPAARSTGEAERPRSRGLPGLAARPGSRRVRAMRMAGSTTGMRYLRSRQARRPSFPRSSRMCRSLPHDAAAGNLVCRKPSCEAATTLKGLTSEEEGMRSAATCISAGREVPVTGASPGGFGAAIARAFRDAVTNAVFAGRGEVAE